MPTPDFRLPDDFPDLTLRDGGPKIPEKVPDPLQPVPVRRPAEAKWKIGDRVLAPWEPQFLYVGVIEDMKDGLAMIIFGDGDSGWVQLDHIRRFVLQKGQKLLSRRKMGNQFYQAEILDIRGEDVLLRFADLGCEEWSPVAGLRIPCQPMGGARPERVGSHLAGQRLLRQGDRVWAPWDRRKLFAGTIDEIISDEAHIHFDDGNQGWVLLTQLFPLEIVPGLPVLGRWKMGGTFYPGRITQVKDQRIFIQYDDGDREWTTLAAVAIPCEPLGPDARATKTVRRGNAAWGWIIPIGIAIAISLARISCR